MSNRLQDVVEDVFDAATGAKMEVRVDDHTELMPVVSILEKSFDGQSVRVTQTNDDGSGDEVRLLKDGDVVATSPVQSLMDTLLLVNSDLYRTSTSGVDRNAAPDVLTAMDETVFTLDGFPESTNQKLLLVLISRYIEKRALQADAGRLDTAFQQLSRIEDESGTRRVYSRLAAQDVDVHVYGVADENPVPNTSVTVHTGRNEAYRRLWTVVHTASTSPAGLLAVEIGDNCWRGVWSYREQLVERMRDVLDTQF